MRKKAKEWYKVQGTRLCVGLKVRKFCRLPAGRQGFQPAATSTKGDPEKGVSNNHILMIIKSRLVNILITFIHSYDDLKSSYEYTRD